MSQQDLAPTLSALTGVPIPRNSLGAMVPQMVAFAHDQFEEEEELAAWIYNAKQVGLKYVICVGSILRKWEKIAGLRGAGQQRQRVQRE